MIKIKERTFIDCFLKILYNKKQIKGGIFMIRCEYCGATYKDDAIEFCSSCGARLQHITKTEKAKEVVDSVITESKKSYREGGVVRKASKIASILLILSLILGIVGIIILVFLIQWISSIL